MSKIDAAKFVFHCQNWYEVALPIALHRWPSRVLLNNGLRFISPLIYWPDIHGIIFQQMYTPSFLPIEQNDVVVDVGANIGVFSLYAALHTRNTVHAFEPFPANFAGLQQNVQTNRQKNIVLHQCAVSDMTGTERFSGWHDYWWRQKVSHNVKESQIDVSSTTLEDFMDAEQLACIDFLKLDCEGSEGVILNSISQHGLKRIRKIALEFHDGVSKLKHGQIQALLQGAGFTTNLVWDGRSKLGLLHAWQP